MNEKNNKFDIAVIGAGPAGMMAAIKASESGARVVVLEKNKKPGVKLLLTGNGICNLTNARIKPTHLKPFYGKKSGFLFHSFNVFGPEKTMEFFESRGLKLKRERGDRIFPVTDKASSVLSVLLKELKKNGVVLICKAKVHRFKKEGKKIKGVILYDKSEILADDFIICSGGKAYPSTGSDGSGFRWATSLSHTVTKAYPVLTPLNVKEEWVRELEGLSLKNVEFIIKSKKKFKALGECVFTRHGVSGPLALSASEKIVEILEKENVKISLNLKPGLDRSKLDKRIRRDFEKYSNKAFKNGLRDLIPSKMIPVIVKLSGVDPEKEVNKITKEKRKAIVELLKDLELTITGTAGFDMAITNSGGVSLSEIDERTMRSKLMDNLFFAGDILDIHGPTGGFNLQICWSTGYLAGKNAAKKEYDKA